MDDATDARIRAYERWICEELAAMGGLDPREPRGTVLEFPSAPSPAVGADCAGDPARDRPAARPGAEHRADARR
jgi:hypothetical protein